MTEAEQYADFSQIRYAQCWEDADILLAALKPCPEHVCLSIASAGDNALALLSKGAQVIAIDLNSAQLACLELRIAAYRVLDHSGLLGLIGSIPCDDRIALYRRCRNELSAETAAFWDCRTGEIQNGIGGAGKFERYFELFRTRILPLIHSRKRVDRLLLGVPREERVRFYESSWNNLRWRLIFRLFFSRFVMGRLGRDPAFFRYVEGSVSDRILNRTRQALTELDPAENPYLQWILTGTHLTALPYSLRPENFESIRSNLHRIQWHQCSIEDYLDTHPEQKIDLFNLSDLFEYMSPEHYSGLLQRIIAAGRSGSRLAYWNMLVPRSRPESLASVIRSLDMESELLFRQDKAWFYSRLIVEEVV